MSQGVPALKEVVKSLYEYRANGNKFENSSSDVISEDAPYSDVIITSGATEALAISIMGELSSQFFSQIKFEL